MADTLNTLKARAEKMQAEKAKKAASGKEKKGNIFKRMGKAIVSFFKELKSEVKKISWPNREQVTKNTTVVIITVIILGAVIWSVDAILALIRTQVLG